jgi:uncharacterized membrane protein
VVLYRRTDAPLGRGLRALLAGLRALALLVLVAILIGYHFYCGKIMKDFQDDQNVRNHVFYRWINEVPVLFLFAIVILAVLKQPLLGN